LLTSYKHSARKGLKPPFVDFDEQTGIYSIRRGNRGRPAMTEEQRAAKDRERVLREAEELGLQVNAD
jgi:hypothetical protein